MLNQTGGIKYDKGKKVICFAGKSETEQPENGRKQEIISSDPAIPDLNISVFLFSITWMDLCIFRLPGAAEALTV